jgi:hypothetical protein
MRGQCFVLFFLSIILTACASLAQSTPGSTATLPSTVASVMAPTPPATDPLSSPALPTTMSLTDTTHLLAKFPAGTVAIQPLQVDAAMPPVWVVSTTNAILGKPELGGHFVALFSQHASGWQQIDRIDLSEQNMGDVAQVVVEPTHTWLEVNTFSGLESVCYRLVMFTGQRLKQAVYHCAGQRSAAPVAQRSDLNDDGIPEIILNQSSCVRAGPHRCDIQLSSFEVLQWDDAQMVPVTFRLLPNTLPDKLRSLNERAIAASRGGLWKEAQLAIDQALALQPQASEIGWNARLIHLLADARAALRPHSSREQPFEYLAYSLAYGDYDAIIEQMRSLSPTEVFSPTSPLLLYNADTITMKWPDEFDPTMAEWVRTTASEAIQTQPDLASAYFLRGWATYLTHKHDPQLLADITHAAQLAPTEPLFTKSLLYLQRHTL